MPANDAIAGNKASAVAQPAKARAIEPKETQETRAMRAVFGELLQTTVTVGEHQAAFGTGKLIEANGFTILVAKGTMISAAHPDPGYIGIWYLRAKDEGFSVVKAVPDAVMAGSFGDPPDWSIRNDLGPDPVLNAIGFGQWFGHAYTCTTLLALRPGGPKRLTPPILTGYQFDPGDDPAIVEPMEDIEGEISLAPKGAALIVRYHGTVTETIRYPRHGTGYSAPRLHRALDRC